MIRLRRLLVEMDSKDLNRILQKIKNKQFSLFGQGDNGRVYEIENEDKLFKITTETEEYRVAEQLIDNYNRYTTFIPVYYVDGNNMYIMAKASKLSERQTSIIDQFIANICNKHNYFSSLFSYTSSRNFVANKLLKFSLFLESNTIIFFKKQGRC